MHVSHEKSDTWFLLEQRNDTEYTAVVTQLRSAWDDQELRDRDRGGKSFRKGRMDWSEDWSKYESSPCAENVFPEQGQSLAPISEDVSSSECVQQAEVLLAEANRTLAQARSAVASATQKRSGFFPLFNVLSSRKGKGKLKGKSKDSSCLICGWSDHSWR